MGPIRFVGEGSEAPYLNVPRHPFKLARLDAELKMHRVARMTSSALRGGRLAGEHGRCNKHEIWRILLDFPWMRRAGCEMLKVKAKHRFFKDRPDSPSRPYRCAGRGPRASLLRSGAEERRVLGSSFAHSGVQVWIRRVHPPCLCVDAPEACAQANYERPLLRRSSRFQKALGYCCHLSLRRRPQVTCTPRARCRCRQQT
ncbi:hypothetical protein RSAG8_13687, partial [Rhizoctonia solani AG-8 WAC10335]